MLQAQQSPAPDQKSAAPVNSSAATTAGSSNSAAGTAPAQDRVLQNSSAAGPTSAAAEQKPAVSIPGFDSKQKIPTYETIQEDWSSLQIGASKLEPQPPMVGEVDEEKGFTKIMARVQWRPGDPVDLWIYLPKGVKNPPVVLYLYSPTSTERFNNNEWASRVTSGGVAAVGFHGALMGPRFHDRPMKQWFISELQESLGSTVHDIKFILDYLDKTGQVDMKRVGMFGEGIGGSIAILAAAADPRIKVIDTLEPWGDWPVFLTKSPAVIPDPRHQDFGKPEFLNRVAPLEPAKWLAELKIPIRIQQVKESETMPEECKDALKAAAPKQAEVDRFVTVAQLTQRENGGRLFQWVKDKLPAAEPGKASSVTAEAKLADEKSRSNKVATEK